jgi:hypothetical protein
MSTAQKYALTCPQIARFHPSAQKYALTCPQIARFHPSWVTAGTPS